MSKPKNRPVVTEPAETRTLTLLRHAKSSWKDSALPDVDRPLNKRGRREADAMAARIVDFGGSFATVFASPARRTRETLARMLMQLPAQDAAIVFDSSLYTFERDSLLDALKTLDDSLQEVMVVGHNPAMQETIEWLTGARLDRFPTAACAQLSVPVAHWVALDAGCAELDWVLEPDWKS